MHLHRAERVWLTFGIIILVVFLGLIGAAALSEGIVPPSRAQKIDPAKISQTPPFDNPGLRRVGDHSYEAYIVARIFSFTPQTISVPAGSKITFYTTSADVVHGFFIVNTDVNMLVVPGWVSSATHVFREHGRYLLLCHEYCGAGHHFMYGSVDVK